MTFEYLELRDKMSWIGYRKHKLSLWDRIKLLLSGCGSHKESAEFRLVSVLTNNDFHSYSLDPNAHGFSSTWELRNGWSFVHIPVKTFKPYLHEYRTCKLNIVCDYGFISSNPNDTSMVTLIGTILAASQPDTTSPLNLVTWLEKTFTKVG